MRILRDSSPVPTELRGAVMALGNFDGLHLGHQAILAQTVSDARRKKKPAALLTFEPHPRRVFCPELPPLRLLSFHTKARLLAAMGIDFLRVIRFTPQFARTPAEAFGKDLLAGALGVSEVVTGEDFVFGHAREGNVEVLRELGARFGFATTACPAVLADGERCSSTRIRALLQAGNIGDASRLLGRPYCIDGRVRHGDRRGRELAYPTANLAVQHLFLPAFGIYAVRAKVRGQMLDAVASLGTRPTFHGRDVRLEVHLFDWQGDLYGERIEVEFVAPIREETAFATIESLKAQMAQDCAIARSILKSS